MSEEKIYKTKKSQRDAINRYILKNKDDINKKNLERHNNKKEDPIYCEKIKKQNREARRRYLDKKKANKPIMLLINKNSNILNCLNNSGFKEGEDYSFKENIIKENIIN